MGKVGLVKGGGGSRTGSVRLGTGKWEVGK